MPAEQRTAAPTSRRCASTSSSGRTRCRGIGATATRPARPTRLLSALLLTRPSPRTRPRAASPSCRKRQPVSYLQAEVRGAPALEILGEIFQDHEARSRSGGCLSLTRTSERIIRLWHVLRRLYTDKGNKLPPLDGDNKDAILQLYSLSQPPRSAITGRRPVRRRTDDGRDERGFRRIQGGGARPHQAAEGVRHPPAPGSPEAEQASSTQ